MDDHLGLWDVLNTVAKGTTIGARTILPMLYDSQSSATRFAKHQQQYLELVDRRSV